MLIRRKLIGKQLVGANALAANPILGPRISIKISDAERTNALRSRGTVSVCAFSPNSTDFTDFEEVIGDERTNLLEAKLQGVANCNLLYLRNLWLNPFRFLRKACKARTLRLLCAYPNASDGPAGCGLD